MTEPQRPLKVFLCHASNDKPKVRKLYRYLKSQGIQPWFDEENLSGGQDWQVEIPKALETSDAIIICLTKSSINKEGYIQKEIKFALDKALEMPEGRIFLIPVKLEECEVPFSLSRYQWVELYKSGGYEKLIKTFEERAKQIETLLPRFDTEQSTALLRKIIPLVFIMFLLIGILLTSGLIRSLPIIKYYLAVPTPTITFVPSVTIPALTETVTIESPNTSTTIVLSTEITDAKGVSMVLVPAGEFIMGSNNGNSIDEQPAHQVYLDAFYIDKYEVTNAQYKVCVSLGSCKPLSNEVYYKTPKYSDHPVTYVDWYAAGAFCAWREARLPTEAEWEKAASNGKEANYPWGNAIDCSFANYRGANKYCVGDNTPVGSYENGKSIYGVYDMVGNVMEWVSSKFADYPYIAEDGREDLESDNPRIIRGGSWNSKESVIHITSRAWMPPSSAEFDFGFRCAKDANP
ncbi:MAG: SUMF1/EgtB/PvdO family nonheme iron enzyme [Anaerolineales bacterium]|nr:SUMF1/EgtB/PvdO family nonheme iron enzyme [Anaerolineales bacterium]